MCSIHINRTASFFARIAKGREDTADRTVVPRGKVPCQQEPIGLPEFVNFCPDFLTPCGEAHRAVTRQFSCSGLSCTRSRSTASRPSGRMDMSQDVVPRSHWPAMGVNLERARSGQTSWPLAPASPTVPRRTRPGFRWQIRRVAYSPGHKWTGACPCPR